MRRCGILMHISSLPGKYGIGTLGKAAYEFVDFLKKSGQTYWQILPLGPTGYGDSPYQCYSAYAGNPLLVDIDMLLDEDLINVEDHDLNVLRQKHDFVDYAQLYSFKNVVFHKAAARFFNIADEKAISDFKAFCAENNYWLEDYCLFMSLKYLFKQTMWTEWDDDIRLRETDAVEKYRSELADEINVWAFIQYKFFKQYYALKKYANDNGIKIYGDMPIYVSMDSSDVWAVPNMFMLDENRCPIKVAGCPPDAFAPTGQLWGNPLYDWDKMEQDNFAWWVNRVEYSARLFDLIRIDHFRGFESFYAIPAEDETAEYGEWVKGPGIKLFNVIKKELGEVDFVAENLGFLTDDVKNMLNESGYPGMNVLEFAFSNFSDSDYLPHNYIPNSVTYIGTHDNDTAMGWYNSLNKKDRKFAKQYMSLKKKEGICAGIIRTAFASVSDTVIIQMQDYLELGSEARMNIPSTIGGGNWRWRMPEGVLTNHLAKRIRKYASLYFRLPEKKKVKLKKITADVKQTKADTKTINIRVVSK